MLVAELCSQFELENGRQTSLFASAVGVFQSYQGRIADWEMLALTLFLKAAEQKGQEAVAEGIKQKMRVQYEQKEVVGLHCFMPIYFTLAELMHLIEAGNIDYLTLGLEEREKRGIVSFMVGNGRLSDSMVKNLLEDDFKTIFTGLGWNNVAFADCILPVMRKHQDLFISKLWEKVGQT